jgi:hypothetical protein
MSNKTQFADKPKTNFVCWLCVVILAIQTILLSYSSYIHSPTHLEVFHLPAGLSHWELSRFDLFRVNPPFVRVVAALPVYFVSHESNYLSYQADPFYRAEYGVGLDTMHANGSRFIWLTTLARLACIPFILLGGTICFIWTRELYGDYAAIISLLLWSFCPYVLGHGSLITPDAHSAALGVAAAYLFWRWLKKPNLTITIVAGIVLGIAELSKFTLLIFYPIGIAIWLAQKILFAKSISDANTDSTKRSSLLREIYLGLILVVVSIFVINIGYDFEGSFKPLGEYRFQTMSLTGIDSIDKIPKEGGNRFFGTWLERIPVPLPSNYLAGIDMQKKDIERGIFSYLNGKWQNSGWWYFYLYAILIKLPLGTIGIILLAVVLTFASSKYRARLQDELFILLPVVVLLVVLSTQTGLGIHSRYVLPALPFLFIWAGKVGNVLSVRKLFLSGIVSIFLVWSVGSSIYNFPHSLSYFNELVGGSANGYKYLAKSDSSWGQDLLILKRWVDCHSGVVDLRMSHCGPFDPRLAGFEFRLAPVGRNSHEPLEILPDNQLGPQPGWYAIDVCFLLGNDPLSAADGKGGWDEPSKNIGYDLSYFQKFKPVAKAGYTINIYHITPDMIKK